MKVVINGEAEEIREGCTVREFLRERGLDRAGCAVEVNRELVPRAGHESRHLHEGDRIEIVTLVGGG